MNIRTSIVLFRLGVRVTVLWTKPLFYNMLNVEICVLATLCKGRTTEKPLLQLLVDHASWDLDFSPGVSFQCCCFKLRPQRPYRLLGTGTPAVWGLVWHSPMWDIAGWLVGALLNCPIINSSSPVEWRLSASALLVLALSFFSSPPNRR